MTTPMDLYLATAHDQPYTLGRTPAEALQRAEARLRAECAAIQAAAHARGLVDDAVVDLTAIDAEPLPLPWPRARVVAVLGAMWDEEEVESELAELEVLAA